MRVVFWRRMKVLLVVKDELAARLDRAVALLTLKTGKRQTRTSFIIRAIEMAVEQLEAEETATNGKEKRA